MPSHRTGPLKQTNKKHKSEKKSARYNGKSSNNLVKVFNKRERRLISKQKRAMSVSALKNLIDQTGDKESPIFCALVPLNSVVPVNLAKQLLQICDQRSNVVDSREWPNASTVHYPSLNKYVCYVSADHADLFGTIDLVLTADVVIILVPSDFSGLDSSTEAFLTCLYAQGLGSALFASMSPEGNLKDIKDALTVRFPIPEDTVHPLNTPTHAINLIRHLCTIRANPFAHKAHMTVDDPGAAHSATRFRAKMLVNCVEQFNTNDASVPPVVKEKLIGPHLSVEGLLRGSPLYFQDSLEERTQVSGVLHVHLSGWGDFPVPYASWLYKGRKYSWHNENDPTTITKNCVSCKLDVEPVDSDCSSSLDSAEPSSDEDDSAQGTCELKTENTDEPMKDLDEVNDGQDDPDVDEEDDDFSQYATRTLASSRGSAYSSAQLAKFRAARMEQMFPDEVETPPSIPAHIRFSKYRCLQRFQGSTWPVESDTFPMQYENIACFKNYHRNRRSIMKYLRDRLNQSTREQCSVPSSCIPPSSRVRLLLGPLDQSLIRMIIEKHSSCAQDSSDECHSFTSPSPLCLWSLLPHENRISVCHFTMHRVTGALRAASDLVAVATAANQIAERRASSVDTSAALELGEEASTRMELEDEEIREALLTKQLTYKNSALQQKKSGFGMGDPLLPPEAEPIRSKDLMLYQVGIRRFVSAPIYSTQTTHPQEKAKFEQFFPPTESTMVASVYAPVMYSPANVLQFRIRVDEDDEGRLGTPYLGELVATGTLHSVDPCRLIIKRIFLSGHPYKIRQRNVVVRFMFFNPTDIEYFKAVPLQTKTGAVGHIKDSVGTHGYMKCVFDRPLQSSDVVLLPLYKRIFPKWVYQPSICKALELKAPGMVTDTYEWREGSDTIQISKKNDATQSDTKTLTDALSLFA